jgi:tetratricopeptide (TPR) repeat protein
MSSSHEQTPQELARSAYNSGIRDVKKADKLTASLATITDEKKKEKTSQQAQDLYSRASGKFVEAVQNDSRMHEAWNYIGYTQRKLGKYEDALKAYDHALSLQPTYAEAIEYRGEAYLGLNRIDDAKQAYLALFSGNRKLADQLLGSMQGWVTARRAAPGSTDATMIDSFDKWVQERAQIAGQTAALTREGTGASWR